MNQPIQKINYLCAICGKDWGDDQEQATLCSNGEIVPQKYQIGDTVYVGSCHRFEGFRKVTITKVLGLSIVSKHPEVDGYRHEHQYLLSHAIRYGEDVFIGAKSAINDRWSPFRPALQSELLQMGDEEFGRVVSPETIVDP